MFGLMKPISCKSKKDYRFHYCGVCKTIGRDYGHKMRLFLNHDITFFAQLLAELSGEGDNWDVSYFRRNCFALPSDAIPLSFSIAAAVNILLAELTLDDKVMDSTGRVSGIWRRLKKIVSPLGLEAVERLQGWGFPVEEIFILAGLQYKRENTVPRISNPEKLLHYYSEYTARITGLIFLHSAALVDHSNQSEEMYSIGFGFGSIVFLLDALEDFDKDARQKNFNAISVSYEYIKKNPSLSVSHRYQVEEMLLDYQSEIIKNLSSLPIGQEKKDLFSFRLRKNLKGRLKPGNPDNKTNASCTASEPQKRRFLPALSHSAPVRFLRRNRLIQGTFFVISIPFQYGLLAFGEEPIKHDTTGMNKEKKDGGCWCNDCCDWTDCFDGTACCLCASCNSGGGGSCCGDGDCCDCDCCGCDCCD